MDFDLSFMRNLLKAGRDHLKARTGKPCILMLVTSFHDSNDRVMSNITMSGSGNADFVEMAECMIAEATKAVDDFKKHRDDKIRRQNNES